MDTEELSQTGRRAVSEADRILRENPVPVVVGALALGVVIGLVCRGSERSREEELRDRLEETQGYLHDLVAALTKATKKGYRKSAEAVRETVDKAVDAARDIDVDDYVDPASKWLRGWWKKVCR